MPIINNPIYQVVSNNINDLSEYFLIDQKSFAENQRDYYVIKKNATGQITQKLQLNNKTYLMKDIHVTIPKTQDTQEGYFSAYHLTLHLEEENLSQQQKPQYKLRIYFDRFDNLCMDPRPCLISQGNNTETDTRSLLKDDDVASVIRRFLPCVEGIINSIRDAQSIEINKLYDDLDKSRRVISEVVSKSGPGGKDHIIKLDQQITILEKIKGLVLNTKSNIVSCDDSYSYIGNIDGYIRTLKNGIGLYRTRSHLQVSGAAASSSQESTEIIVEADKAEEIKQEQRQQSYEDAQREKEEINQFITGYQHLFSSFKESIAAVPQNTKNEFFHLRQVYERSQNHILNSGSAYPEKITLYELHQEVVITMERFCNDLNVAAPLDKVRKLIAQNWTHMLSPQKLNEIAMILVVNNDHMNLNALLKKHTFSITEKHLKPAHYIQAQSTDKFSLLEWCAHLGFVESFKALIRAGHGLEYFSDFNSPVSIKFRDSFYGKEFISVVIQCGKIKNNSLKKILTDEIQMLYERLNAAKEQNEIDGINDLLEKKELQLNISNESDNILNKLKESRLSKEELNRYSANCFGLSVDMASNLQESVKEEIRNDTDFLSIYSDYITKISLFISRIPNNNGQIIRNIMRTSVDALGSNHEGDVQDLTLGMLKGMLKFNTNVIQLRTEYLQSNKAHLDQNAKFLFNSSRHESAYNNAVREMQKHIYERYGPAVEGLESSMKNLIDELNDILKVIEDLRDSVVQKVVSKDNTENYNGAAKP